MAVIAKYTHNNCKVIVHDDYIQDTDGVKRTIDNLCQIIVNEYLRNQKEKSESP